MGERLGLDRPEGLLIALVKSGSPADEAGSPSYHLIW
jgi:S1-C subfamily serine protease